MFNSLSKYFLNLAHKILSHQVWAGIGSIATIISLYIGIDQNSTDKFDKVDISSSDQTINPKPIEVPKSITDESWYRELTKKLQYEILLLLHAG